ncbi:prepilin peptidase [Senegalimassilia anaerobia]|uniref:prepilin peptidase n=1 Tax=Senegalimassilia anaerobia TaxID=1473216 RepID=UPI003AAF562E
MLLSRAYLRSYTWWYCCLDDFAHYRDVCPDRLPRQNEKGTAGAVGIWLADCRSQVLKGALTHERAEALREAGIDVGKGASTRSEVEQQRRCSFSPRSWQRAVLAAAMALWFAAQPLFGVPWHQGALLCVCGAAMASGVVCDLRARMIPLECCAALLVAGGAYQLLRHGSIGIVEGAVAAAAVLAVCWTANRIARKSGGSVGFGDIRCMTALAFACGPATLLGAAACYASACAFSLAGMLAHRLGRRDGIPMAPFLSIWLAVGTTVLG